MKVEHDVKFNKTETRQHWIQRITFAAETNAECSSGSADTHTHTHRHTASKYLLSSLSGSESNEYDQTDIGFILQEWKKNGELRKLLGPEA